MPVGYLLTLKYGMLGATAVWLMFGFLNVTIVPIVLHRRTLKGTAVRWYLLDIGIPLAATSGVALLARLSIPAPSSRIEMVFALGLIAAAAGAAAAMAAPAVRGELVALVRQGYRRWAAQRPGWPGQARP